MIIDNKEYKEIPNWDGYFINSDGVIVSFFKKGSHKRTIDFNCPTFLKPSVNSTGYPSVSLYKHGIRKVFFIHRLVALLFIGEPPPKTVVDHIDGNRKNCSVNNLRYITQGENVMRSPSRKRFTNGMPYKIFISYNGIHHEFDSWNKTIEKLNLKKFSINYLKYVSKYGEECC